MEEITTKYWQLLKSANGVDYTNSGITNAQYTEVRLIGVNCSEVNEKNIQGTFTVISRR